MSRASRIWALAMGLCLGGASRAGADVIDAQSQQTIKTFLNRSAAAIPSGSGVVFDFASSSDVTGASKGATSTVGIDITTTTTVDSRLFVGVVVQDSCPVNGTCQVVTNGPALARFACGTDSTEGVGNNVGTAAVAGLLGSGSRAGILLSRSVGGTSNAADNCLRWVYVDPDIGSP